MLILTGNRESWSMHYLVDFSICTGICVIFKLEHRKNFVIQRKVLITNIDIKFDSNRNINQAEIYHKKSTRFWSPVILPKRMVPLKYITWRAQISKKKTLLAIKKCLQKNTVMKHWLLQFWRMNASVGSDNVFVKSSYDETEATPASQIERKDRTKQFNFVNRRLCQKNGTKVYINWWSNGWELSRIYKTNKTFTSWTLITRFLLSIRSLKDDKQLFVTVFTDLKTYAHISILK